MRTHALWVSIVVSLLSVVASGCSGGGGGGESAGGSFRTIQGAWIGTVNSSQAGAGTLGVFFEQNEGQITGFWATDFDNPVLGDSGTLSGVVAGSTITATLSGSCAYFATATTGGITINGSYSSNCSDSGSFTLVRE